MNDKVDVLKLMDYMISQEGRLVGLHEARAAVAELIEVSSLFDGYVASENGDTSILDQQGMWDRLSAALARVKGGEK